MSLSTSPFLPDMTARLRLAGSSCLRRWRAPRAVKRDQSHRRFDALMVLLVIAAVVVVAIQADAGTARWVPGLSAGVKAVVGRITASESPAGPRGGEARGPSGAAAAGT